MCLHPVRVSIRPPASTNRTFLKSVGMDSWEQACRYGSMCESRSSPARTSHRSPADLPGVPFPAFAPMHSINECVMHKRTPGSELGLCTNPITFGVRLEPPFTRRTRILISMDRVPVLHRRGPARERGPDFVFERGSGLRWHPYGGCDRQYHRLAVWYRLAQPSLQASNKPERDPIEPQARRREAAPVGDPLLDCRDLDGNSLPGDREIGVGWTFAFFPGRREMPRDGLEGGPLVLPQSAHARMREIRDF